MFDLQGDISHNIISILDYDDGRENPIATTVGFDCISITFKVASAAVGDLHRPHRFFKLNGIWLRTCK